MLKKINWNGHPKILAIILSLGVTLGLFQNCGQQPVEFSGGGSKIITLKDPGHDGGQGLLDNETITAADPTEQPSTYIPPTVDTPTTVISQAPPAAPPVVILDPVTQSSPTPPPMPVPPVVVAPTEVTAPPVVVAPPVVTPPPAAEEPPTVICDPFTSPTHCDAAIANQSGLLGHLYYLRVNLNLPGETRLLVDYFVTHGVTVENPLLLSQINVSPRKWDQGFPIVDGYVKKENGADLFEWFAYIVGGQIRAPSASKDGHYQFATVSDDGAFVEINGKMTIDDQTLHSPRWKCSTEAVNLSFAHPQPIRVGYYQGPRYDIAMVMYYRPWSARNQSCSDNGSWQVVPAEAFLQ